MLTGMAAGHPHDKLLCLGAAWLPLTQHVKSHTSIQKSQDEENKPHGVETTAAETDSKPR